MPEPASGFKTLAIRLSDELHAQLVLVAQLDGATLADTMRQAIERSIEARRANGELAGQAAQALAEFDRETNARRQALAALVGDQPALLADVGTATRGGRRTKNGEASG